MFIVDFVIFQILFWNWYLRDRWEWALWSCLLAFQRNLFKAWETNVFGIMDSFLQELSIKRIVVVFVIYYGLYRTYSSYLMEDFLMMFILLFDYMRETVYIRLLKIWILQIPTHLLRILTTWCQILKFLIERM